MAARKKSGTRKSSATRKSTSRKTTSTTKRASSSSKPASKKQSASSKRATSTSTKRSTGSHTKTGASRSRSGEHTDAKGRGLRGVGDKEERMYEHIKEDAQASGRYGQRAKEVAARTVMKMHKARGHKRGQ